MPAPISCLHYYPVCTAILPALLSCLDHHPACTTTCTSVFNPPFLPCYPVPPPPPFCSSTLLTPTIYSAAALPSYLAILYLHHFSALSIFLQLTILFFLVLYCTCSSSHLKYNPPSCCPVPQPPPPPLLPAPCS